MTSVQTLRTRDEIPGKYKWKLDKMYPNQEMWEEDLTKVKALAKDIINFKGKLHNITDLKNFLNEYCKIETLLESLSVFANMKYDEDTTKSSSQVLKNRIESYASEYGSTISFFIPEILSIENFNIDKAIAQEPELEIYRGFLKNILDKKPHTLSEKEEALLAGMADSMNAPVNIYSILTGAELEFPTVTNDKGEKVQLTEGNYVNFLKSPNRAVRKEAFETFFGTYAKFKNTFATTLISDNKNHNYVAKVRNYKNSLEAATKPNHIPVEVYYNVVNTINDNLESLHKYVTLKKRLLGVEEMHMYDLYMPLIKETNSFDHIGFEDGVDMTIEALKPLGEDYLTVFKEGIENGWVDVFESKGKKSGAYSWGSYTSYPYILLNYNYTLNAVSTFAHEMGHSMHSYYSRKNQPFITANYSLFCAEVASITNECLFMNYLINKETDKFKKLSLINEQLESIRATVFRQAMFAEFELAVHEKLEAGISLSAEDLCKIYHDINVKYFGPDMVVDEGIDLEWSRIPHFYLNYYVYQYTTGFAAGNSFAKLILEKGDEATSKYLDFLKSGCKEEPIELLSKAGVDMTSPKPLQDTIERFNELLEVLEKEL